MLVLQVILIMGKCDIIYLGIIIFIGGSFMVKMGLKVLGLIIGVPVFIFGVYLLGMVVTDYRPKAVVNLIVNNSKVDIIKKDKVFTISTFNIGYCGMDA